MLPKNLGNPYFDTSTAGAEEAAGELEATIEEVGPETGSPDAQVQYINTAAQQGVGGLIVSANDPTAICDAIEEAQGAGIKVVTFDSDTSPDCRDLFVNQATPEGIAAKQLELISEQIGGSGEIAILSASANATNQNAWIEMMEAELESNADYAGIELVDTVYGDDEDQKSFDQTEALLPEPPEPQGHHLADHGRHRRRGPLPAGLAVQGPGRAHRARHAEPDASVRRGRHRAGRSRCGTRATWATSPRTPPRP